MKYMGSKKAMLGNGLGQLIDECCQSASRFIDLFAGSAAVSQFVAQRHEIEVVAYDLQEYSVVLANSFLSRTEPINVQKPLEKWLHSAEKIIERFDVPPNVKLTRKFVEDARAWSQKQSGMPITKAYGGHYFSPTQSIWLDALRKTVPRRLNIKSAAIASLIDVASYCAASPGHTAQPFQPTKTAKIFLEESWNRPVVEQLRKSFAAIASTHSKIQGRAAQRDANIVARYLKENDLVFIDPPYSGVHYSRFYHVLETIAHGSCGEVFGRGRYPASKKRPRSRYSVKSEAASALEELLLKISNAKASAILTFPTHSCSNGLDGKLVSDLCAKYFHVDNNVVDSRFSTLGGTSGQHLNEGGRMARQYKQELILLLNPR
jgi:adenine-specific DNA-methyltransferase